MMSPEEIMSQASAGAHHSPRRRRMYWIGLGALILLLAVVVPVTVTQLNKEDPERKALRQEVEKALKGVSVDVSNMNNRDHYQGKAMEWLWQSERAMPDNASADRTHILQRFALACFYYSTNKITTIYTPNPPAWKSEKNWLSQQNECEWEGVQCSSRLKVNGIVLESNFLTGKIPPEITLLRDHLETLDLTTNLLYMESRDFRFFTRLTKLVDILMDDNYVSTEDGLPTYLGACTDLERIRFSYNLLGGQLDNTLFRHVSKLTHLEIESNFLTGTIPGAIGHLQQLVYLYMRRNSMSFNMNWVKTGKLHNLFALWLDANELQGTIPTEIGQLSELASLSLTNGTLTGPIPTEIGRLSNLRRLWLYGNQLTGGIPTELGELTNLEVVEVQRNDLVGSMPPRVCSFVGLSQYVHKSLAADCQEVTCDNCCTHCH